MEMQSVIGRLFGADNRPKHYRCTSRVRNIDKKPAESEVQCGAPKRPKSCSVIERFELATKSVCKQTCECPKEGYYGLFWWRCRFILPCYHYCRFYAN